MATCISCRTSI